MTQRVANASPIVFLAKLGRLDLLGLGVDRVLVPSIVLKEIRAKRDEASAALERSLGRSIEECRSPGSGATASPRELGEGERDVIAQALQNGIPSVALDDLDAKRAARRLGLEPIGTIELLLAAKMQGKLPALKTELDRLRGFGFRVSIGLEAAALREANEP